MFKLSFVLKQQTPLIHFQHDQEGATLRATEVKPKLDKFIIEQLGKGDYDKGFLEAKKKSWLIGKEEKGALNYQMRIKINDSKEADRYAFFSNPYSRNADPDRESKVRNNLGAEYVGETQYFADNEKLTKNNFDEIKVSVLSTFINVELYSYQTDLIAHLNEHNKQLLKIFFVSNNFGTRQTKGFGCFLPDKIKDEEIVDLLKLNHDVIGVFKKNDNSDFINKIKRIAKDYALLKRGASFGGYKKSKLWEYLCANGNYRWEKRKIKVYLESNNRDLFRSLKHDTPEHRIDDCPSSEDLNRYYYIRALLGLAEQYEFVRKDNTRLKVKIKDQSPDKHAIERYQSPIRYIVTDSAVLMVAHKINPDLTHYTDHNARIERKFDFSIEGAGSFSLSVPSNFDLADFLEKKAEFGKNLK
jgi:hypothetical protein